jgi:hypothetical protein
MQNQFGPDAAKIVDYFREHRLIAGDFVVSGPIGQLIPDVGDCVAAVNELTRAGWLMVDPKSPEMVPNLALTDFGYQMIHQPGTK